MSPLIPILGIAAAAFLVLRKGETAKSQDEADKDAFAGYATAYAYLDSEPVKDRAIDVDLKAVVGKPPGMTRVTPRTPPAPASFPDGRKGRSVTASISTDGGQVVGTAQLYFP